MQTTCETVEKTYASVVPVKKSAEIGNSNASQKTNKGETNTNISQSLRVQGVPVDPSKRKEENFVPKNAAVNDILDTMGGKTRIVELKRLGMVDVERKKSLTLLVTLPKKPEARLTLAKGHEHREMLNGCFNITYSVKRRCSEKNLFLKKRRELLD